ncbi:ftsK/SpoIIIE family protein [Orientia chuto str. Dubai]|uniref:DNA translocase FtsK n=1 Tax=Orientia chuto str. Dubai TaxID=1359168 RepID=A0A0F3MKP4_9RICK|nr:ftsK/SpoIIIE family protein [Orientia chuto str. Dubai]
MLSYDSNDPGFNIATDVTPNNLLGNTGANFTRILLTILGSTVICFPILLFALGRKYYFQQEIRYFKLKILSALIIILECSYFISNIESLDFQYKGIIGSSIYNLVKVHNVTIGVNIILITVLIINLCFLLNYRLSDIIILIRLSVTKALLYIKNIIVKIIGLKYSIYNSNSDIQAQQHQLVVHSNDLLIEEDNDKATVPSISPFNENNLKLNVKNSISANNNTEQTIILPGVDLLGQYDNSNVAPESEEKLIYNSKQLLKILNDFGIKGHVFNINQGPVVTLYEFEPAAGTKSSRVIGLSDDIARSLSALSTRISVIPGKNVLGIELPNLHRMFFSIRELIETPEYQRSDKSLPVILGKDLSGEPEIIDLAKMPHLLVAGTTGSGKSVAINAMIISLLYRLTPNECKFIMIDPKMLELSVYEGIPHLLTPVVTDPSKAVVALKWGVKEMESRYRLMSTLGVRNIAGYNSRIEEAIAKKQVLAKTLHTGFDPETGQPIYESIPIPLEKLPFIVIIVDEMADLMIVAGKDIESSIQRLAQMARAAGIHIIMATQRPSVDVITGVIKANFPSRISFKVTSRIDSRTILGEMGAEQLLGMGDMLYMGNGTTIKRVHAPFVDDSEVEQVAKFLRAQATPQYIDNITEISDDNVNVTSFSNHGESADDESLYKQAVQIVKIDKRASTSYIQRSLRIGYNRAALIVERMEREGIISPPNHSGKREILIKE